MKRSLTCSLFLLPAIALLLAPTLVWADNWPQWRGPTGDGISKESKLPTEWADGKNVLWKLPLPGVGSSTPAVWGEHIFLTCDDGKGGLVLICAGTDGKEKWTRKLGSSNGKMERKDEGNQASASPSTDGKHVFAFVGSGDLACYDLDGKKVWDFNVQDRYGKFKIQFGMHSTPVLHENRLYLQLIHSGGATVAAINTADGKEVWKIARKSDGHDECEHSYASPCLWQKGKDAYLVVHGNDYATAHSLKDGSEIWRVGDLNLKTKYNPTFRFVASPVATEDLIVVPSCKSGPVVGVKPDAKGMVMTGSNFEQWRMPKNTPDVPSPLVKDGLVYLCRETGNLICLDAKTGQQLYEERTHNARHRGSPVFADDKIYLTARDGTVSVVKAGKEFKLLASNKLSDDFTASPAIAGGRIYLRGFNALYAIGEASK